jgi:YVTN family beta-propeller protein
LIKQKTYLKKVSSILLLTLFFVQLIVAQSNKKTYKLIKTITGYLSPKSISNNGKNLFFAQNMMYNHTVTVYDSTFNLVSTISDNVKPAEFGFKKIKGSVNGSPVESIATKDGKYLWVSNYNMVGDGFTKPGCDTCCGKGYDESMVYKVNTANYKIENIVKVGSVPKYLTITPDQKKLIVSNWTSGDVSIISLDSEKEIKRIYVGAAPRGIACDTGSIYAYIAVMGGSKIVRINLNTYQTEAVVSGVRNPRHLCIKNNYLYASLNGEQAICRVNLSDMSIKKITIGKAPRSMVISSVNNKLFVDCYEDSKVAVIDLTDFKVETEFKTNKYPIGICLSRDNKQIWVSCYTGTIEVFSEEQEDKKNGDLAVEPKKVKVGVGVEVNKKAVNVSDMQNLYVSNVSPVVAKKTVEPKDESTSYIVLGSFAVKENALNLKSKLTKEGINIELIDSKKGFTYCACKVKSDKDESDKLMALLEAKTGIKGWVYSL